MLPPMSSRALAFLLALAVLAGCSRTPPPPAVPAPPADAIAKVGDEYIRAGEFEAALARRRAPASDPKARRAVLDELIRFRAEVQEARRRGYDRDPEIVANYERALSGKIREAARTERKAMLEVKPEEVEAYYTANQAQFAVPVRVRLAQIVVEAPAAFTPEKRAERRAQIEEARARALAANLPPAGGFGPVAAEVSFDQASKYRGGDIGYLTEATAPPEWTPAVKAAAFALAEPGQMTEVIETPAGFLVLRLAERAGGGYRPGPQVQAEIRSRLAREKEKELEATLARASLYNVKVEVDETKWSALPMPAPGATPSGPPPMPGR